MDGCEPMKAAKRVNAWASVWGIRNSSRLVARQLRYGANCAALMAMKITTWSLQELPPMIPTGASILASKQGGHEVKFRDMPIKTAYWCKLDSRIEDVKRTEYGDIATASVFGVVLSDCYYLTRFYEWTIQECCALDLCK